MDPITALLGGVGSNVIGGLLGELFSSGDKAKQRAILQKILADYQGIEAPEQRQLTSEVGQVTGDPALEANQMQSLAALQGVADSGGLTLADMAAQKKALDRVALQDRAQRQQIDSQMQARGAGSSGASLAQQLSAQQGSAERGSDIGMQTAGNAQARALQAIMGRGQMSGQMRGQKFGEQMQAAQARDVIDRYNSQAGDRDFHNRLAREQGIANASQGVAQGYGQDAQDARTMWGNFGQAGSQLFNGPKKKNPWEDSYGWG